MLDLDTLDVAKVTISNALYLAKLTVCVMCGYIYIFMYTLNFNTNLSLFDDVQIFLHFWNEAKT